jgi:hypothetical protein
MADAMRKGIYLRVLCSLIEKSLPPCGQCCLLLVELSGLFGVKIGHEEKSSPLPPGSCNYLEDILAYEDAFLSFCAQKSLIFFVISFFF